MKTKTLSLLAPALITAWCVMATGFSQGTPEKVLAVMNPAVANKLADRLPLAPRLDTLEGKTLYMVDINWGGPEAALSIFEEMQAWFAGNMPGVKTVIKMKRGGYETDDPALWKEIHANNGSAAILGVSG